MLSGIMEKASELAESTSEARIKSMTTKEINSLWPQEDQIDWLD